MSEAHPPRIALASCTDHPEGLGGETLLPGALVERGAEAAWAVWNDPDVDWAAYDLVVVRCTWDYPDHLDGFRAWVQAVAMSCTLVNPPRVILGNLHKGYLADMGDLAVPTVVVPAGMTVDLAALDWPAVVVTPAAGAGGRTVRAATQEDLDALTLDAAPVDVVVQPLLEGAEHDGEISVVCLGGEPTHAVRRKPAVGELRVDEHVGGAAEAVPLAPDLAVAARRAVASLPVPVPAPVARVDLVRDGGRVLVAALELVEPYLWLELAPEAAGRLADVVIGLTQRPRRARV